VKPRLNGSMTGRLRKKLNNNLAINPFNVQEFEIVQCRMRRVMQWS
jgi:hypothetical protein